METEFKLENIFKGEHIKGVKKLNYLKKLSKINYLKKKTQNKAIFFYIFYVFSFSPTLLPS